MWWCINGLYHCCKFVNRLRHNFAINKNKCTFCCHEGLEVFVGSRRGGALHLAHFQKMSQNGTSIGHNCCFFHRISQFQLFHINQIRINTISYCRYNNPNKTNSKGSMSMLIAIFYTYTTLTRKLWIQWISKW